MADDRFIDLTGSPPPSPTRSPRLRSLSTRRNRHSRRSLRTICLNCAIRLIANSNRFHATCIHGNPVQAPAPAPVPNYVPPVMNELGAGGTASLSPYWNQPLIPHHDLFMLGMLVQWQNRLMSRIARNIVLNTRMTPPPVQSYENSFSGEQSSTYPSNAADVMIRNENLFAAPNMSSYAEMEDEPNPALLPLFPAAENNALAYPPEQEGNGNHNDDGDDDLDLELNLGGSN